MCFSFVDKELQCVAHIGYTQSYCFHPCGSECVKCHGVNVFSPRFFFGLYLHDLAYVVCWNFTRFEKLLTDSL